MRTAMSSEGAYHQGQLARKAGKSNALNPYLAGDKQESYLAWLAGWQQEDRYIRGIDLRECT